MDIQARLKEHYDFACQKTKKDRILGVFLYGSQNYGLDTETSDVDTKAIYIPTFEEIVFNKPISVEFHLPNGEHCEVKDIREYVKNLKKQSINFVETLFTKYFILNPKYEEFWNKYFIDNRDFIARYDTSATIYESVYRALHALEQAAKSDNSAVIGKKYCNVMRSIYFLENYVSGNKTYEECIRPEGVSALLMKQLKEGGDTLSYETIYFLYRYWQATLEGYLKREYIELKSEFTVNALLDEAILEILRVE